MNQAVQQISPSPAQRLADKIRARTNNGRDLIDLLHDIAQGGYDASNYDRVTASKYLFDRGYGKCPKQTPVLSQACPEPSRRASPEPSRRVEGPASDPNPNPAPETPYPGEPVLSAVEGPPAVTLKEPESPRLVNQIGDSLHDALGPAPKVDSGPAEATQTKAQDSMPPEPFDPFSIQSYIIEITNDGETLVDVLVDIAFAADDDSKVTPYCRSQAGRILSDRSNGTDPASVRNGLCPDCRRKWSTHDGSHTHTETHPKKTPGRRMSKVDPEALAKVYAKLKQMEDEGILTPDPNAEKIDITPYLPPQDFDLSPYAKEEAAKFWADIELRYERQQQWPAIEERRRKKLAQIYPSHSDDKSSKDDPPDTSPKPPRRYSSCWECRFSR